MAGELDIVVLDATLVNDADALGAVLFETNLCLYLDSYNRVAYIQARWIRT
jgi:hypothetical protein